VNNNAERKALIMLTHDRDGRLYWTCDICRRPGVPGEDLVWAWREGVDAAQCHVVHNTEECRMALARELITNDEVMEILAGDVSVTLAAMSDWDFIPGDSPTGTVFTFPSLGRQRRTGEDVS
jgi:hypothetical protein